MKQSEENCVWFLDFVFSQSFGPFFSSFLVPPQAVLLLFSLTLPLSTSISLALCQIYLPKSLSSVTYSRLGSVVQGEQALRELLDVPKFTYLY